MDNREIEKKIWFVSDTHFGHSKEFLWAPRGFNSSFEHDAAIIKNWNEVVGPDDDVYHLGDVMLEDNEYGLKCLKQLKGHIHIIIGNHDTDTRIELYKQCHNVVEITYSKLLKINKQLLWLCHYPTITANYDDNKPWAKHLINIYGHTHQQSKFFSLGNSAVAAEFGVLQHDKKNPYMYCVCLDAHNNKPVELQEIIDDIRSMKIQLDNQ